LDAHDRTSPLQDFGDVFGALDRLPLPVFAIAGSGVIRWLNMAAEEVVGKKNGRPFTDVVAPESQGATRDAFASKVVGSRTVTDYDATLIAKDGSRVDVEVCSVPVDGDAGIAGVFGAAAVKNRGASDRPQRPVELTPRQAEVLQYLARGYKTETMAEAMGVTIQTVRNHVRGLLRALGAHSRLEAVAMAHMRGLI
jgi:DNA-binding CsgD family transcriptional regulator